MLPFHDDVGTPFFCIVGPVPIPGLINVFPCCQSVSQQVNAFTLVVCRTCIPNPLSRFPKPEQAKVMYLSNLLYVFVKVVKSICICMGPSCLWQCLIQGVDWGASHCHLDNIRKRKIPKRW